MSIEQLYGSSSNNVLCVCVLISDSNPLYASTKAKKQAARD